MGGEPPARRPRRAIPLAMAALLVAVAAGGGVEIGHAVWGPTGSVGVAAGSRAASSGSAGSGTGGSSGQAPNGSGGSGSGSSGTGSAGQSPSGSSGSSSGSAGSGAPADVAAIAKKAAPALVDINVTFSYQNSEGAGTGIVLTSTGEILTNNHVINGATTISVTDVGNGKTYSASVVGYDRTHDIAVLQLHGASGLTTASLGDSSKAAVGQAVVAIGNAGGSGGTPSSAGGSITAVNQSITAGDSTDGTSEQLSNLIEVNADVQPGDSGGALVNADGQVIGMNTAASEGFSFQGPSQSGQGSNQQQSSTQGFAIPINQALATARQMEAGQGSAVVHIGTAAFLGVMISSSGSQNASGAGGSGGYAGGGFASNGGTGTSGGDITGAVVGGVVNGTSAAQAGITAGNVITSLGGTAVDSAATLSSLMITHHPGDKVRVGWTDSSGQAHTATVVLGSGPPA
ncbi:MAG: S1C family serine protease [Frankia sp.]